VDAMMLEEVLTGLARPQKELSPKYFYDHRGSELFEAITRLPEYYLTGTEETLLSSVVPGWIEEMRPRTLVELGAGSASKSRALLGAMVRVGSGKAFVPVDVSGDFLRNTVLQVRTEYPGLSVEPVVADITQPLALADPLSSPTLFVLLGSTIGNFPGGAGISLLSNVAELMGPDDRLLMGADLRPGGAKSRADVEAAYNDAAGVTAQFNLNVLRVLNRTLGTDFRLDRFSHLAFYDDARGRIEMHLRSSEAQTIRFPGGHSVEFAEGETVRTEVSGKYDREAIEGLLEKAGLALDRWTQDEGDRFSMSLSCRAQR
jgi:L-histidine N-alpha-methyltransferase